MYPEFMGTFFWGHGTNEEEMMEEYEYEILSSSQPSVTMMAIKYVT